MKRNEKLFVNLVSNVIIVVIILTVITLGFSGTTIGVSAQAQPIYKGENGSSKVSLMFNVYSGNEYLKNILATLKKHNVHATFFVGGCWVEKNSELFLQIVADGHEIGNHGYFHKDQDKLSEQGNYDEISVTHKLVQLLSGVSMTLFAPPSGAFSKTTLQVAEQLGYKTIMWSRDTIDWRDQNVDLIVKRATSNIDGGELILMHPTKCTDLALDTVLNYYKTNGFQICTVSENINNRG